MKALNIYCLLGLAIIFLSCPKDVWAQTGSRSLAPSAIETNAKDEVVLLRALVDEVQQLRLTLQRTALGAYRCQVVFERQRLQQGRVDSATRELQTLRLQLDNAKFSRTQFVERAKETQEQLDQEQDQKRRNMLEQQLKEFKIIMSTQSQQDERQRDREVLLTTQVQAEQLKLDDLTNQLDNLERELVTASRPGARDQ
jgi:SMC interacting uncharacterized protein involved in chromosome segregation